MAVIPICGGEGNGRRLVDLTSDRFSGTRSEHSASAVLAGPGYPADGAEKSTQLSLPHSGLGDGLSFSFRISPSGLLGDKDPHCLCRVLHSLQHATPRSSVYCPLAVATCCFAGPGMEACAPCPRPGTLHSFTLPGYLYLFTGRLLRKAWSQLLDLMSPCSPLHVVLCPLTQLPLCSVPCSQSSFAVCLHPTRSVAGRVFLAVPLPSEVTAFAHMVWVEQWCEEGVV